jgi:hypothetical protein
VIISVEVPAVLNVLLPLANFIVLTSALEPVLSCVKNTLALCPATGLVNPLKVQVLVNVIAQIVAVDTFGAKVLVKATATLVSV